MSQACAGAGAGAIWEISVPSIQFCGELKLPLKSLLKYYKESRIVEITKL